MNRSETQEFKAVISKLETENKNVATRRPRSLTTLKLEVVAERARKMKRIKEALQSGTYNVQRELVAKSILKTFSYKDIK